MTVVTDNWLQMVRNRNSRNSKNLTLHLTHFEGSVVQQLCIAVRQQIQIQLLRPLWHTYIYNTPAHTFTPHTTFQDLPERQHKMCKIDNVVDVCGLIHNFFEKMFSNVCFIPCFPTKLCKCQAENQGENGKIPPVHRLRADCSDQGHITPERKADELDVIFIMLVIVILFSFRITFILTTLLVLYMISLFFYIIQFLLYYTVLHICIYTHIHSGDFCTVDSVTQYIYIHTHIKNSTVEKAPELLDAIYLISECLFVSKNINKYN